MRRWLPLVVLSSLFLASPLSARPRPASPGAGRFVSHSININMTVTDPAKAAERSQRLLKRFGGEIQHSNSAADSASVNARVPAGQLQAAASAIKALPGTITNSNAHTNDMTQQIDDMRDKLRRLKIAERELARAMKTATAKDAVEGLMAIAELIQRERQNLRNQLSHMETQARFDQLHVGFTRPS